MEAMFDGANNFSKSLSQWDTSSVTTMANMLLNSGVTETFCGGAWGRLTGQYNAFTYLGSCTARYKC